MRDPNWPNHAGPGTVTFFYTNLTDPAEMRDPTQRAELMQWCVAWLRTRGMEKAIFAENALDIQWANDQVSYIQNGAHEADFKQQWGYLAAAVQMFSDCFLQALSLAVASPDVYLFIRAGTEPDPNSIWSKVEFWPLTRPLGVVQRVWRVDPGPRPPRDPQAPRPVYTCAAPELIWDCSRDQPLPRMWECPVTYDDGSVPNLPDPWAPVPQPPAAPPS